MSATLNGNIIAGVGITAITRKGMGESETLGWGLGLRLGKQKANGAFKYSFDNLAELVRGSSALEEQLDKYTKRPFKTRRAALQAAAEFADTYHVPMLDTEAAEWEEVKDSPEEAEQKAEKAKKGLVERLQDILKKAAFSDRLTAMKALMAAMLAEDGLADATQWLGEQAAALQARADAQVKRETQNDILKANAKANAKAK